MYYLVGYNRPGHLPDADPIRFDGDDSWAQAAEYLEETAAENGDIELPTGYHARCMQLQLAAHGDCEYTIGEHTYFITPIRK